MSTILSKAYVLQKALKQKGFVIIIDKKQMYNKDTDTLFSKYVVQVPIQEFNEAKNKYYTKYKEIFSSYKPVEIVKFLAETYKNLGDT